MFRSKRSTLVKELWKSRITDNATQSKNESEELEIKSLIQSMLKRLKEQNLEILLQSIESKGGASTPCVLLPLGDLKMGRKTVSPQHLCCQIWRWPGLSPFATLRRLPCCETVDDPLYACCNPYHWSLQQSTDSITVANCECLEKANTKISGINCCENAMEGISTETGNTPTARQRCEFLGSTLGDDPHCQHWCSVAYWELRQRVGRLYVVHEPYLNIFQKLPHGGGLSLELLQGKSDMESVRRTRDKIGLGLVLSKESNGVWIYNRSNFPIFVNSPTLDNPNSRTPLVIKVSPGYSMNIFDYDLACVLQAMRGQENSDGPYDPTSIRISFAKGWGPSYHRQFITSCPAWLEILLNVNR